MEGMTGIDFFAYAPHKFLRFVRDVARKKEVPSVQ